MLETLALSLGGSVLGDALNTFGWKWGSEMAPKYNQTAAWESGNALYDKLLGDAKQFGYDSAAGKIGAPAIRRAFELKQQNYAGPTASSQLAASKVNANADRLPTQVQQNFNTQQANAQRTANSVINNNMIRRGLSPTQVLAMAGNVNAGNVGLEALGQANNAYVAANQAAGGMYLQGADELRNSALAQNQMFVEPERMRTNSAVWQMPGQGLNAGRQIGQDIAANNVLGGTSSMIGSMSGMGGTLANLRMYENLFNDDENPSG